MARKKKSESPNPGLTPPALLDQIKKELSDGEDMQTMHQPDPEKGRAILPKTRTGGPRKPRGKGVFGAPDVHDGERGAEALQSEISDLERSGGSVNDSVTEILRGLVQEEMPEGVSYLRGMLKQIVMKASKGEQWAVAFIADRLEGKPGQAPKKTNTLEDVEATINQVEIATLNRLLEKQPQESENE